MIIKYQQIILYGIFGVMTTIVNWATYSCLIFVLPLTPSNIVAWVAGVVFAFFVNKKFVFKSKSLEPKVVLREALTFLSGRIVSGVVEMGGPELLVRLGVDGEFFGLEGSVAKAIISVFVIIMNFVFSKLVVFRKIKEGSNDGIQE